MTADTTLLSAGNYILSYLGACDALSTEQNYLDALSKSTLLPESERAMAAVVAATIGIKLLEMNAKHEAFMLRLQDPVRPPSDAQIKEAVRLSTELAKNIRTAVVASSVLTIVTQFITDWTSVLSA